jgi:hypothetical protein
MSFVFLTPVLAAAVITVTMNRLRFLQSSSILQNGIRLSVAIGVIRILVVWISTVGLRQFADWRQGAGYLLLMLNSFGEIFLARSWRNQPWGWPSVLSGLVALSSLMLGLVFATLVQISRRLRTAA